MKPKTGEIVESLENLNVPVSATKFGYGIAVALDGNGSITLFNFDGSPSKVLADGFEAPTHVINYEEGSEYSIPDGDGFSEASLTESPSSTIPHGTRDLAAETFDNSIEFIR